MNGLRDRRFNRLDVVDRIHRSVDNSFDLLAQQVYLEEGHELVWGVCFFGDLHLCVELEDVRGNPLREVTVHVCRVVLLEEVQDLLASTDGFEKGDSVLIRVSRRLDLTLGSHFAMKHAIESQPCQLEDWALRLDVGTLLRHRLAIDEHVDPRAGKRDLFRVERRL